LAGRARLEHAPIELGDVLMALLARWKMLAPAHSFELALPGELPVVLADAPLAEEALHVLIEAVVLRAKGGGTIRVELRPTVDDVVVRLRHPGAPLDGAQLAALDTAWPNAADLDEALAPRAGLAFARAVLSAHGGRLWAEAAEPGCGALTASWPLLPPVAAPVQQDALDADERAPVLSGSPLLAHTRPVVLVIEHDPRVLRYLRANLEARQYRAVVAAELAEALALIELEEPDLLLCEIRDDAPELLDKLREATDAPLVLLTGRYDHDECARLLRRGAADYIAKPFHLEELLARVAAALRTRAVVRTPEPETAVFRTGTLEVDLAQRLVTLDGQSVALSRTEFKLLRELVRHAGMVMPHESLLERVWGPAYSQETEFIWVYIRRLRRKIEPDPSAPRYIQTVPGVGYRLVRV
ncbi:MAG: winged helix-turn-helix domain-containing protein, partial [Ktedonobacterales bacterium]